MKKILLLLIPMVLNAQNPPPPTTTIKPNQQLGSATNNQGFTQSKSFKPMQGPKQKSDGGSKVRAGGSRVRDVRDRRGPRPRGRGRRA